MKIKDRVEQSLKYNPELRDSDKKLLLHEWQKSGLHLSETQRQVFMSKCAPAESITRARRLLKSQYPASKEVNEARYNLFEQYKRNVGEV